MGRDSIRLIFFIPASPTFWLCEITCLQAIGCIDPRPIRVQSVSRIGSAPAFVARAR